MKKFGIIAISVSLLLMIISPLWGHFVSGLARTYEIDYIYALYLACAPWLLTISAAGIWIIYKLWTTDDI